MKLNNKKITLSKEELLDQQTYKNYFLYYLIDDNKNKINVMIKIVIALLLSYIFDFLNLFKGYSFYISYFIIEIIKFNFIDKKKLRP